MNNAMNFLPGKGRKGEEEKEGGIEKEEEKEFSIS